MDIAFIWKGDNYLKQGNAEGYLVKSQAWQATLHIWSNQWSICNLNLYPESDLSTNNGNTKISGEIIYKLAKLRVSQMVL